MQNRIHEAVRDLCRKHGRLLKAIEGWLLLALVVGGSFATGHFVGLLRSDVVISEQMRIHQAEQQRLMDINRQLMLIIERRLPAIAETASGAAEAAKEAATTAHKAASNAGAAGRTAKTAASTAKAAAATVSEAAADVKEAVTPQPVEPKDPPDWLGGS